MNAGRRRTHRPPPVLLRSTRRSHPPLNPERNPSLRSLKPSLPFHRLPNSAEDYLACSEWNHDTLPQLDGPLPPHPAGHSRCPHYTKPRRLLLLGSPVPRTALRVCHSWLSRSAL